MPAGEEAEGFLHLIRGTPVHTLEELGEGTLVLDQGIPKLPYQGLLILGERVRWWVPENSLDTIPDGRVWFQVLRVDALPQAMAQLVVFCLHQVFQFPFRIAHDPELGPVLIFVLLLSPCLKVHNCVLNTIEVELGELYCQVEVVEAPLLLFIDNLYLPVGQSVQPVHRHDAPFPVLLHQLAQSRHLGALRVQLPRGLRVLAPVSLHALPHAEVEYPLSQASLGSKYGDGGPAHNHGLPRAVYVVHREAENGGLGDVVVVGGEENPLVPVPAFGEGLVCGLRGEGDGFPVGEDLSHDIEVREVALVEPRELKGGVIEQCLYAFLFSVTFQRASGGGASIWS